MPADEPSQSARGKAEVEAMGVPPSILTQCVRDAYEAAARRTEHDVLSWHGFTLWAVALRRLREELLPEGWSIGRGKNFETVVAPDASFAVAVAPGDANTGTQRMPSTRTERGPQTKSVVSVNRQLAFDPQVVGVPRLTTSDIARTWFLLHFHDELRGEIRLELALPVEFTPTSSHREEHGSATRFHPRWVLDAMIFGDIPVRDEKTEETKIEVPVTRRTS